ncbi:MAG: hypothetical protein NT062_30060 [Proteobacteria bacterium]|nr:hypothetical protein [Pseudomonadota bacterium]
MAHDGGDADGGTVEIIHESLIERWPTLRRWLDEDHEEKVFLVELGAAAKQWDVRGRPAGLVWRGEAMEETRRWYVQRPRQLPAREQAFVDAVLALGQRGRRVRRFAFASAILILVAIAGGATTAYVRVRAAEQEARENATDKEREAARAQQALAVVEEKDRARQAAEERQTRAEAATRRAQADGEVKDVALDQSRQKIEANEVVIKLTHEQLEAKVDELQRFVADLRAAQQKAEQASKRAGEAVLAQKQISSELERITAAQRAKIQQLEEEKRKLSTKLKE